MLKSSVLTPPAISQAINSYMVFFFYFQLLEFKYAWNVKVAGRWSDASLRNVPLRNSRDTSQPCLWLPVLNYEVMIKLY